MDTNTHTDIQANDGYYHTNRKYQKHKTKSEKFNEVLDKEILKVYVGSKKRYGALRYI